MKFLPNRRSGLFLLFCLAVLTPACSTKKRAQGDGAERKTVSAVSTKANAQTRNAVRLGFEKELSRAYPVDAPPATSSVTFELLAKQSSVPRAGEGPLMVWSYNGQVPGPVLRVRLGQEVVVKLKNELPQPTTIHWHGVRVPNAMDGVPGVTQDAVPPGESFTYRFVPKDAGTFWFHPHVRGAEQVERGLYGVLIVDDTEPLPYTKDEVWVLDDWRLGADGQIDPRFVTRHDLAHDGRWGKRITVNGDPSKELLVRPGERIRLRLVNTSNARVYRPDFTGLNAQVIAVDGMYSLRPLPAKDFELAPGNRLDLDILIPRTSPEKSIKITDRFSARRAYVLASIRIEGEPVETPQFAPPSNTHIPQWNAAEKEKVDVTYVLNARRGGKYGIQWTINGRPWGKHRITELSGGKWTKVRFKNDSGRLHPMHIHGQFFKVIARNGKPVNIPYLRDTVLLHPRETLDIGMVPVDWGTWMMHCHILEHAEAGMMTTIEVAE